MTLLIPSQIVETVSATVVKIVLIVVQTVVQNVVTVVLIAVQIVVKNVLMPFHTVWKKERSPSSSGRRKETMPFQISVTLEEMASRALPIRILMASKIVSNR